MVFVPQMQDDGPVQAIYFPEIPRAPAWARDIIARIKRFCLRLEYVEGKEYISSLPSGQTRNLFVAAEIAILHTQHGNYIGAERVFQSIHLDELLLEPHSLLREEVVLLALVAANVKIATHFHFEEAIALANEVDQIYITRTCRYCHLIRCTAAYQTGTDEDLHSQDEKSFVEQIMRERQLWNNSHAVTDMQLTDTRVCFF